MTLRLTGPIVTERNTQLISPEYIAFFLSYLNILFSVTFIAIFYIIDRIEKVVLLSVFN